jgi:hypothetical protein
MVHINTVDYVIETQPGQYMGADPGAAAGIAVKYQFRVFWHAGQLFGAGHDLSRRNIYGSGYMAGGELRRFSRVNNHSAGRRSFLLHTSPLFTGYIMKVLASCGQ